MTDLPDGPHRLSIVAIDRLRNEAPRPGYTGAARTPQPAAPPLMSGPEAKTEETTARFDVSVENGATLECSLDGATFIACGSPIEFTGLPRGKHTLQVRQIDAAGNTS